jgi:hypothetical protein
MMSWYVVVVAKFKKGLVERVVVYKFLESQDLKIVTIGDKFEKKDLEEMILGDKLMPMQGLEEDIKGDKFQQMQDLVGMRKVEMM